ncbi:MAG: hypothetical protein MJ158_01445 [Alphaproteobacteria bacterium]|nr:hypothetical protein [Alphaproteobacteria bacterium]
MKNIIKYLCRIVAIICILNIHTVVFADTEATPISQSIQLEQTNSEPVDESLQTKIIRDIFVSKVSSDATNFQQGLNSDLEQTNFVPIEAKLALMFMKAVSAIDPILQMSLVRFVIIFLLIAFTFWVGIEGYNLAITTGDYKKTIYNIIKQGLIISVWIMVLQSCKNI